MEKLIAELIRLGWYPEFGEGSVYVNGYLIQEVPGGWFVSNSEGLEKTYKRFQPMVNFITNY
jgi:hypothetical protein